MKITELIEQLEQIVKSNGDAKVITNGEHGYTDLKCLDETMINIEPLEFFTDEGVGNIESTETVLYIGDY